MEQSPGASGGKSGGIEPDEWPGQVPPDNDYWDGLIDDHEAAKFIGFSVPFLQNLRSRGGGPTYSKINQSVRHTRRRLKRWADERLKTSTSDPGQEAA